MANYTLQAYSDIHFKKVSKRNDRLKVIFDSDTCLSKIPNNNEIIP